jgi:hypothetical protein
LPKRQAIDIVPGIVGGALVGLFALFWTLPLYLVFPGDMIVLGALAGGPLGYYFGADFFRWVRDLWTP